jgi:hypothetical protein
MKIPEKIRIWGIEYTVDVKDVLTDGGAKVLYGDVDYGRSAIHLNSDCQNHQRMCVTLWHEIFHAVAEMNGLELGGREERIIDAFAFGVYQILQDNGNRLFDLAEPREEPAKSHDAIAEARKAAMTEPDLERNAERAE